MSYAIRLMTPADFLWVRQLAQQEGLCPGAGDLEIYWQTDRQGLWIGEWQGEPVGCIAGVKYQSCYGIIYCPS